MTQCYTVPGTQPISPDPVKPSQNKFNCSQEELKTTLYGMGKNYQCKNSKTFLNVQNSHSHSLRTAFSKHTLSINLLA